jgi:DNA-binding MarR family transcriptional regulator
MSVIVGNLIRKKALEKHPHPDNARIQQLSMTELGARLQQDGAARLQASQSRMCSVLPLGAEVLVKQWLRAIAGSGP